MNVFILWFDNKNILSFKEAYKEWPTINYNEMTFDSSFMTLRINNLMFSSNGYIITWMLHQFFMYSNKVILADG